MNNQPESLSTSFALPKARFLFLQAFQIYRQKLPLFLGILIIPTFITITFSLFGGIFSSKLILQGNYLSFLSFIVIFSLVIFLIQAWGQLALIYAIKDHQEKIGVTEAYRRAREKFFSYLWLIILIFFINFGALLFFIIPGLIFIIWFSLAGFILVAENLKGMKALLKSREYIRGKWWVICRKYLFIGFLSLIFTLAFIFVFNSLKIPFGQQIAQFLVNLFLLPLIITYIFLIYENLKTLKGEFVFEVQTKEKIKIIFISLFGYLLGGILLFLIILGLILGASNF